MKLTKLSMCLLATGALAQIANENDYEDHCAVNENGKKEEIHPGYWVEYYCGTIGPYSGPRVNEVTSAGACAKLCQDRAGCTDSSWSVKYDSCFLGPGEGANSEPADRAWTLYMKDVTPPPEPERPVDESGQSGASVCQRLHEQCLQQMQTSGCSCSGNPVDGGSGGGNEGGNEGGNGGENEGENEGGSDGNGNGGSDGLSASGGNPDNKCLGYNDGAVLKNGKKYTLTCGKYTSGPQLSGWNGKQVPSAAACLKACTDYPLDQCKRAVWTNTEIPHCTLYGWINVANKHVCDPTATLTTDKLYNHAVRDCPQ